MNTNKEATTTIAIISSDSKFKTALIDFLDGCAVEKDSTKIVLLDGDKEEELRELKSPIFCKGLLE